MESVSLLAKFFGLAFSALLPVINPLGSALMFLGLVGPADSSVYRNLARKIAISTTLFLVIVELVGTALLAFFGISLPVVQVAGGLVLATMERDPSALVVDIELCPRLNHCTCLFQIFVRDCLHQRLIAGTKAVRLLRLNREGGDERQCDT